MSEGLIDFTWPVHRTGYAWSNRLPLWRDGIPSPDGPYLISGEMSLLGGYDDTDGYRPLDDPRALFRVFARTLTTPKGILSFANRFGMLGVGKVRVPTTDEYPPHFLRSVAGEPYDEWKTHIETMRTVLVLWRVVKGKEHRIPKIVPAIASQLASVSDNSVVQYRMDDLSKRRPSRQDAEDALYFVINDFLQSHATMTPQFDQLHIWQRHDETDEGGWNNPHDFNPRLTIAPSSLLGALWFQLARAVAGNVEFRSCRQCGTWFEIDHSSTRSGREFCSEPCRSRSYRLRIASAQELHTRGVSVSSIADRLGSTEETVAGWIKKKGRSRRINGFSRLH